MSTTEVEELRQRVSAADASLKQIFDPDPVLAQDAVFDLVRVLTAAKAVVLAS